MAVLDYLAAFETLIINRKWGDFCAIFRARRAFKRHGHSFDDDRKRIQDYGMKNDGRCLFSIVKEYYLHKHHRYSELPET